MTDFPTNCDKCGTKWLWNKDVPTPIEYNAKRKYGWWISYYDKKIHDKVECKRMFDSLPYPDQVRITETLRKKAEEYKKSLTDSSKQSPPQTQKLENVVTTKFEFIHLQDDERESIQVQTRELYEILQVIKLELKEEPNPAVIGMIFNALVSKLSRGKKDE